MQGEVVNPQLEESVETESVVESLQLNESVEAKTQVISMYHEKTNKFECVVESSMEEQDAG